MEQAGNSNPASLRKKAAPELETRNGKLETAVMYSPQLLDHFQNPRNAGDISEPDASAEVENPVCGDVVRLSVKVQNGKIAEAQFKAKGCVPAMACASLLTELIVGRNIPDARALSREDIITAVGGLPQASTHAAQLALDVLNSALRQLK